MCFHKSIATKEQALLDHYSASFQSIHEELELMKEKFTALISKDGQLKDLSLSRPGELHELLTLYSQKEALPAHYTKAELAEMKWQLKMLSAYREGPVPLL